MEWPAGPRAADTVTMEEHEIAYDLPV
jgi:hypothetical protein